MCINAVSHKPWCQSIKSVRLMCCSHWQICRPINRRQLAVNCSFLWACLFIQAKIFLVTGDISFGRASRVTDKADLSAEKSANVNIAWQWFLVVMPMSCCDCETRVDLLTSTAKVKVIGRGSGLGQVTARCFASRVPPPPFLRGFFRLHNDRQAIRRDWTNNFSNVSQSRLNRRRIANEIVVRLPPSFRYVSVATGNRWTKLPINFCRLRTAGRLSVYLHTTAACVCRVRNATDSRFVAV